MAQRHQASLYNDVLMSTMASQITDSIVWSTVSSGVDPAVHIEICETELLIAPLVVIGVLDSPIASSIGLPT